MTWDPRNIDRDGRRQRVVLLLAVSLLAPLGISAQECNMAAGRDSGAASDSAFHAMQHRGATAMGVDQNTSTHHFTDLPDGGRIELERNLDDSAGVAMIRHHLHMIARAFGTGDFSTPMFVHMRDVPGTTTMAAKRNVITYTVSDLPQDVLDVSGTRHAILGA